MVCRKRLWLVKVACKAGHNHSIKIQVQYANLSTCNQANPYWYVGKFPALQGGRMLLSFVVELKSMFINGLLYLLASG